MRCFVLMTLLIGSISVTKAQQANPLAAINFDSVPLFMESKTFAKRLQHDTIVVIADKIRLSLSQRVDTAYAKYFWDVIPDSCLTEPELKKVCYRFIWNRNTISDWKVLPQASLLFDTILQPQQTITLQLKRRTRSALLQQTIISRPTWKPVIRAFRQKDPLETFDGKIKSKEAYGTKLMMPGFNPFRQNTIIISPGKQLELQFENRDLNIDSCIEYRLQKDYDNKPNQWQISGHLLHLHQIIANHSYALEVRYAGANNSEIYSIEVLPYWWQKGWAIGLFVIISLLIASGIPLMLYKRHDRKSEEARQQAAKQLKSLQHKLPPHFVRNAATSIVSLVADNQNESANLYLLSLTDIMSDVLNSDSQLFVRLSRELSALRKYISLEQLRFGFRYAFEIDAALDLEYIDILPFLLQPSIENAVKHGVAGMYEAGMITIQFSKKEDDLVITIHDNGQNRKAIIGPGHGHGIAITKERIRLLGIVYPKEKIKYVMEHNTKGTTVRFCFSNYLR